MRALSIADERELLALADERGVSGTELVMSPWPEAIAQMETDRVAARFSEAQQARVRILASASRGTDRGPMALPGSESEPDSSAINR